VTAEDTTNQGRVDMTVKTADQTYIFEFTVVDIDRTLGTALEQIRQKRCSDKYGADGAEFYLIGIEFDRKNRNIVRFERGSV